MFSHNHTWCGNSVPLVLPARMAITATSPILKQTGGSPAMETLGENLNLTWKFDLKWEICSLQS